MYLIKSVLSKVSVYVLWFDKFSFKNINLFNEPGLWELSRISKKTSKVCFQIFFMTLRSKIKQTEHSNAVLCPLFNILRTYVTNKLNINLFGLLILFLKRAKMFHSSSIPGISCRRILKMSMLSETLGLFLRQQNLTHG